MTKRRQRSGRLQWILVALLGLVGSATLWSQDGHVPAEIRNRLKKSTVWIRTANDGDHGTGTGFVIRKDGDDVYIATNNHVIDAQRDGQQVDDNRTRFKVLFAGEDPNAKPLRAELLATDKEHDLAIMRVRRKDAPEPFDLFSDKPLGETLPITVFGFPSGDRAITIENGQITSFQHDVIGGMRRIKMFSKVDPGNSGGPVVDGDGAIIGVTVEKDRKLDNVGYAIPAFELHEMLRGRLGNFAVRQEGDSGDFTIQLKADVLDPYDKLKKVKLHYIMSPEVELDDVSKSVTGNGAKWSLLSKNMKSVPVSVRGKEASMTVSIDAERGTFCFLQLTYERDGEPDGISQPFPIILGGEADDPKGDGKDDGDGETKKPRPGKYPLPGSPMASIMGERVDVRGYRVNEWTIDAGSIIPNVMWDEHSIFVYMVTKDGVVKKVDPFRNQIDLENKLKVSAQWSVLSGEGVLVLTKDDQLWIVDDRTLKVRRVIEKIPDAVHVTSSPKSFYAFCATGGGTTLEVYDLVDGEKTQTYEASQFELPRGSAEGASSVKRFDRLTMSPDGRFLFCESEGALHRFKVTDDEIVPDQATGKLARDPGSIEISEDGVYVSLIDRAGNREAGGVEIQPFGVYVFEVRDLVTPVMAIDGGQPTPFLEREDSGRAVFGTVKNSPLVKFDLEGTKVREFPELEGEFAKQILVYPKRPGFLIVLTDAKAYVLKLL